MKKRPASVLFLTVAFCLGPVGVVAELVYFYHVPLHYWYMVLRTPELWNWQTLAFAILSPVMGFCVWTVHRWGYIAVVAFSGLIIVNNIVVGISGRGLASPLEGTALFAGLALLVLVEIRKEFFAPYFNPRLRWWEQARRYATDQFRVVVKEFGTGMRLFEATSFDISATGIYVVSDQAVRIGDVFGMDVVLPVDTTSHVTGEVVWRGRGGRIPQGFGCRFTSADRRFKADLRAALRALHATMRDDRAG